ncbi:hypothetical protein [Anaerovibrio sp. RM50]|uniref:hypothetical protein n=1 Tax=Anaerovibrio sp. RM50 TaxID=1200557 RepID=UPI000489D9C9|nr:hypothetical protein [Anaerovibrio sp. RM50]
MANESTGCGCLFIILAIVVPLFFECLAHVGMTFTMPTGHDYVEFCYKEKVFKEARKMAVDAEKKYWENHGYSADRDVKTYETYNLDFEGEKDDDAVKNRTTYLGQGTYEVMIPVTTHLGFRNTIRYYPEKKVGREYKVIISCHPKRRFYGTVDLGLTKDAVELVESVDDPSKMSYWEKLKERKRREGYL